MCTVVILRRPDHPWPLVIAANRDEMKDRPWRPPARHWPDRPGVVAGLDEEAGGSWLGLNDHGVVAGVLNRVGSLGPRADKRSRGALVLQALDHGGAAAAARALSGLDPAAYRSFNLVIADAGAAFWLRSQGEEGPGEVEVFELPAGLSMLTARELNDQASPRIRNHRDRFLAAPPPEPARGDWDAWCELLSSREADPAGDPLAAMTVVTEQGFETVSSSLIALPARSGTPTRAAAWLFAAGRPDLVDYEPVAL